MRPIKASLVEPVDAYFEQRPVSLRLPLELPPQPREIFVVRQPDYTPVILAVCLLGFFGFLAFLASRKRE